MDVAATGLDTYNNSLQKWTQWGVDGNLFLEGWQNDDAKQYPKVLLRYIGCKGGSLPPPRATPGFNLQTATTTDGSSQLQVLYRAPTTTWKWISRTGSLEYTSMVGNLQTPTIIDRRIDGRVPPAFNLNNRLAAAFAVVAELTGGAQAAGALSQVETYIAQNESLFEQVKQTIKTYFNSQFQQAERVIDFQAEPIVPGQYWACSSTVAIELVSN